MPARAGGLSGAIGLLTRFPSGDPGPDPAAAVPWLPVVGAGIGALVAATYGLSSEVFGAPVGAVLAIGAGMAATGALHEDGLADVFDAAGAGGQPEERRAVARDPHLGTFGVLALVSSVVVRIVALAGLRGWTAAAALITAHCASRGAVAQSLTMFPPAPEGLGAAYSLYGARRRGYLGLAASVVISAATLGVFGLGAVALSVLSAWATGRVASLRLGGLTGDAAGAIQQVAEILVLCGCLAVSLNGWADLVWWAG